MSGEEAPGSLIPVIDISRIDEETGSLAVAAAAQYGFLFVNGDNLGFSKEMIDHAFSLSQRFFASPMLEKEQCAIQSNNIGWSSMHSETLDPEHQKRGDFKEAINFGEFVNGKAPQRLPPALQSDEPAISSFQWQCHQLCVELLHLFALGLKIPSSEGSRDWFAAKHEKTSGPSGSVLRWLHYPKVHQDTLDHEGDIRAGAHSDYGSLTLLFQRPGQPGLEILTPHSTWSPVPIWPPGTEDLPFPPILVNIGDLMQFWTEGMLKSTVHRVVFPPFENQDRYSIAYFCHPLDHIEIEPVPSQIIRANCKPGMKMTVEMTAIEYLKKRLEETYNWGESQKAVASN